MEATSVNLQDFATSNEKSSGCPILRAARQGDAAEMRLLLREKSEWSKSVPQQYHVYPENWKYRFKDLLQTDREGRTALHLAASVGNHAMAYDSVTAILESIQMLMDDEEGTALEKHVKLVNLRDKYEETPLHLAVNNRASKVVAYLLENQANLVDKNAKNVEALPLIYQTLPDAMYEVYDNSIQLSEDYKSLEINWGPVTGFRQKVIMRKTPNKENYRQVPRRESVQCDGWWNESECLKYVLNSDQWGAPILLHPVVKLYLELKWRKIHWFFWVPFVLEMLWLTLYSAAFIDLNLELKGNATNASNGGMDISSSDRKGYHLWWIIMAPLTVICTLKEIYQMSILRMAYFGFENLIQLTFILLFALQFGLLMADFAEIVATLSVIGIILSTVLMVFQLGKTPYFGLQVAALKKVIYSCAPHLPVFFVWFIGFGLIFWAIFYKADESWLVGMVAIMAAMGTGELNAKDHLEPHVDGGEGTSFKEVVRVLSLLFFVIVIVTLYFNLLIGYAVSDIQVLKTKAEALELSNKLSTIYTIESFLISKAGQKVVWLKCKIQQSFGHSPTEEDSMGTIYVLPPSIFKKFQGIQTLSFDQIPAKLLVTLKEVAFANIIKEKERAKVIQEKILELLEPNEAENRALEVNVRS